MSATAGNAVADDLVARYPALAHLVKRLTDAACLISVCHDRDGLVLVCGNGGSAADAAHIVGELAKGFLLPRAPSPAQHTQLVAAGLDVEQAPRLQRGVRAIDLSAHAALLMAVSNDLDAELVFAQQAFVYGRPGDVLIALSTSGNARNVVRAAQVARAMGVSVIGFTGASGGDLARCCDVLLNVPATETYQVQELHLPLYHALCAIVEAAIFGEAGQ